MIDWEIIRIEINDDLGSICEKITNSRFSNIIIVLPRQRKIRKTFGS